MPMPSEPSAAFGDLLKRYRLRAGLTQEELAERAQLSRAAIETHERGARHRPHTDTAQLLAEALRLEGLEKDEFLLTARQRSALPPSTSTGAHPPPVPTISDSEQARPTVQTDD